MSLSRLSSEEPAMIGYLVKQGKTVKNWKRRWFVLQGTQLTYAKDTTSKPLGVIQVKDYNPHKLGDKDGTHSVYRICLQHKPTAASKRDWYLEADSSDSREKWFNALLYASGNAIVATEVLGDLVRRANQSSSGSNATVFKTDDSALGVSHGIRPQSTSVRSTEVFRPQDVVFEEKLGDGESGEVWRGRLHGQIAAIRKLNDSVSPATFFQEATTIMMIPEHKNIVRGLGVCQDVGHLMIAQEYVSGVSLKSKIDHIAPNTMELAEILRLLIGVAQGMELLASKGVVHRSLRAANVMVASDGTPKITDFGYSRVVSTVAESPQNQYQTARKYPVSAALRWWAPENIVDGLFSEKSDVWSFGILAMEMLLAKTPYGNVPQHALPDLLRHGLASPVIEIPTSRTPPWLQSILKRCFAQLPAQRPTFQDLVQELDLAISGSIRRESTTAALSGTYTAHAAPVAHVTSRLSQSPQLNAADLTDTIADISNMTM